MDLFGLTGVQPITVGGQGKLFPLLPANAACAWQVRRFAERHGFP